MTMKPRFGASLFTVLLLGGSGCSPESGVPPGDLIQIVHVEPLQDTASLYEVWQARLPDSDPTVRLTAVAALSDGAVLIATDGAELRRVSADGHTVTELPLPTSWDSARVSAMVVTQGGDLLVLETGGRLARFRDDLLVEEMPVETGPLLWGSRALQTDASGGIWVGIQPGPDDATITYPRPIYRRLAPDRPDTLWLPSRLSGACPVVPENRYRSGWYEDFRARYVPFVLWTMAADGALVAGCPSEYEFEMDSRQSNPTLVRMSAWTTVAVSAQERRDFELTWAVMLSTRAAAAAQEPWDPGPLPDHKPAYTTLLSGSDGRIWVWTAQPSTTVPANPTWPLAGLPDVLWIESGSGTFDVFDSAGRLEGHVRLPSDFRFTATPITPEPVLRGDTVWAATVTPDGGPAVTRFVVDWP